MHSIQPPRHTCWTRNSLQASAQPIRPTRPLGRGCAARLAFSPKSMESVRPPVPEASLSRDQLTQRPEPASEGRVPPPGTIHEARVNRSLLCRRLWAYRLVCLLTHPLIYSARIEHRLHARRCTDICEHEQRDKHLHPQELILRRQKQTTSQIGENQEEERRTREKEMAAHSSILARKISWTEEPGGLHSMGSRRAGHD